MDRAVTVELSGEAGGGGRIGGAGTGGTTSTVQVEDAKVSENAPEASVCATTLAARSPMPGVESVSTTPASGTGVVAPGWPSTACSTLPDAERRGCSWKSTSADWRRSMPAFCRTPSCWSAGARTSAITSESCDELPRHSPRKHTEPLEHCALELQGRAAPLSRGSRMAQAALRVSRAQTVRGFTASSSSPGALPPGRRTSADSVSPPQRATKPGYESSVLKFVVEVRAQDPLRPTCELEDGRFVARFGGA